MIRRLQHGLGAGGRLSAVIGAGQLRRDRVGIPVAIQHQLGDPSFRLVPSG